MINWKLNQILNIVIVFICAIIIKDVVGVDTISKPWKRDNPGEIKNNGTTL